MKKFYIPLIIILSWAMFSCNTKQNTKEKVSEKVKVKKEDLKSDKKEETKEVSLDDLMKNAVFYKPSNDEDYSDFKKSKTGLLYKFHRQNTGETLTVNDVVEIEMNYYLNDSLLFTSSAYPKQFKMPVEKSVFKGDLYEGMAMMHVGDSASFVVRADSTYIILWKKPAYNIKPSDVVRFDIGIISKEDRKEFSRKLYEKKKAQAEQSRNDLQIYIHDNDIVERPRPSGLIVIPILKGYGPKATSGDIVKIHYTATLLNGTVYKTTRNDNVPVIWKIGELSDDIPRGMDEALQQMHEGDVTKFIIPSHLAFGQKEILGLPPFANFIYEVEMIEIIKNTK